MEKGESETAYQERLRAMNAANLAFGGGARMCTGSHIAMLEVYKMVATLMSRFEIVAGSGETVEGGGGLVCDAIGVCM